MYVTKDGTLVQHRRHFLHAQYVQSCGVCHALVIGAGDGFDWCEMWDHMKWHKDRGEVEGEAY